MSTYDPEIKIYYGAINNDNRLIPAPDISISIVNNYSNDTIIGYTYNVVLTGVITALDLRNLADGDPMPSNSNYNIGGVVDHIHKVRKILSQNGSILHIVKSSDDSVLLKAKGGILRSLSFDESPNNWYHYASYTATLEFHSVDLISSTEDCSSIFLDPSTYSSGSAGIVDISKFKIKAFQDSWNISFDENEAFSRAKNTDITNININNRSFNIRYTISATGKHFFDYTDEETGAANILPAWEQAKNFAQYRLYEQVTNLLNSVLKNTYTSACSSSDNQSSINIPGSSSEGLLKDIGDSEYKIFNEQISCEASESDGTFSATYSAIVKTTYGNTAWTTANASHSVSKSKNYANNGDTSIVNININGTIQGYVEGGLLRSGVPIQLPSQGSLFVYSGSASTKYNNAKELLDKIYSSSDYGSGLGIIGKRDLKPAFKNAIGATMTELEIAAPSNDPIPDPPHPISFNLTHDYNNGTINYSAEYSSNNACGYKYKEINFQISNPTKVIATFNIPNSNACPVIQELGTYTAKKISVTINGIDNTEIGQPTTIDLDQELTSANGGGCYGPGYLPIDIPYISPNSILTEKQYTKNPMDGSYTVNLTYICGTQGCA